ncbi:multicopper oxidase domain-containing protein [Sneathiella marina]|uniref:Multicopper oxidase domain-containing protein n=1 Tax=Sneathiella marina TaxID=2950108 RepID=A0ABY4W7U0_9PROT|nr:multicopper oxidase domain-containing protein [Sneathiella marina]USG62964.1 multicopper oxidase domain-containing protein [Sneathiella marina]
MDVSRRFFLAASAGLAAGASVAKIPDVQAASKTVLRVKTRQIEVEGKAVTRYGIEQNDGTFGLFLNDGEPFNVQLVNELNVDTLVHWHGMEEPWRQDGVPYLSAPPIKSGGSMEYQFAALPTGTRWMHSHFGLQEQNLLAAPLIIRDKAEQAEDAQEVVLFLEDFAWRSPEEIFAELRKPKPAMSMSKSSSDTGKSDGPDLNDVDFDAYLANDRTLDDPEIIAVEKGGRIRLRVINASASSEFTVDLGAVQGSLVAVDGNPVQPVSAQRFPLAIAQRADIMLTMPADGSAVPVLALGEGRKLQSGIILRPKGAAVAMISAKTETEGPRVELEQEALLRAVTPLKKRQVQQIIPVDLTGFMSSYIWNMPIHGQAGMPAVVEESQRVELVLTNKTSMSHPMHLHGHSFQVVEINGTRFNGAMRDTIMVPPRMTVTVALETKNPGLWAFHCHNLYHLAAGMFSTMAYREIPDSN